MRKSPKRPAATPVSTTASQNFGVRRASPSWVTLGCSMAPRPEANSSLDQRRGYPLTFTFALGSRHVRSLFDASSY